MTKAAVLALGHRRRRVRSRARGRDRRDPDAAEAEDLAIDSGRRRAGGECRRPPKIAQRAQPGQDNEAAPAPAAGAPATAQPGAEGAAPAGAAPQQAEGQLPGAARAAMLIASADNPQKPVVNLGSTGWSTCRPRRASRPAWRSRPTRRFPTSSCTPR